MSSIQNLEPKLVWQQFADICKVPRPSKKEEKIIQFLLDFGATHQLETSRDEIGNILIKKAATEGYEDRETVVLQSHMDMVCEKNDGTVHNFDTDPIVPVVDGDWLKADGTTLGADDGIGVATQLAILISKDIEHGPLECLFTVDEETGLTGAKALQPGFFDAKILINLDSEDEGELFVGCAGGVDTVATFEYRVQKDINPDVQSFTISVKGLLGGHSGDDINKGHGNAVKVMTRLLWTLNQTIDIHLASIDAGNMRNAIAREAFATISVPSCDVDVMKDLFEKTATAIKEELSMVETRLNIEMATTEKPPYYIDELTQDVLLDALYACPHGVHAMSYRMPGMVETSTNLASVKMMKKNKIQVTTSQRSDSETAKYDIAQMVEATFMLAGADVEHTDGYPGWAPNPKSAIMECAANAYEACFGKKPIVRSIHAGLECGLFLEKYPYLDMISFGPTLRQVHTPEERIEIKTVQMFWDHLLETLKRIPQKA